MPAVLMHHDEDPRKVAFDAVGDVTEIEVFNNQVLVAVYERPERTKGGLLLTQTTRDEDKSQGKVGLIVKVGPRAFKDPKGAWEWGDNMAVGDWIFFRASDGWATTVNTKLCRLLDDTNVRGRIPHPDIVW